MTERLVTVDRAAGVELCLDEYGDPAAPTVLLIAGAAASMDLWDPELCRMLSGTGRHVVRYDHRDTGRSTTSPPGQPTYRSEELFCDPVRLLDAIDVEQAHLVGLSMGGGIAQVVAVEQPERVLTLTLMSTSAAGERADRSELPGAEPQVAETFTSPIPNPDWSDREAVISYLVESERPYAGSLGFDEAAARLRGARVVDRSRDVAAAANHWMLEGDSPTFAMNAIGVPTLVVHGTADPMFPLAHGQSLAVEIPDARLVTLAGVGHEVPPPQLWATLVAEIAQHTSSDVV
jgi:pimeloyl-ACP methyl ester carboxylesterase